VEWESVERRIYIEQNEASGNLVICDLKLSDLT